MRPTPFGYRFHSFGSRTCRLHDSDQADAGRLGKSILKQGVDIRAKIDGARCLAQVSGNTVEL